jgi:hypothetical protein
MCSGIDPEVFASAGDGLTRAAESRSDTIERSRCVYPELRECCGDFVELHA